MRKIILRMFLVGLASVLFFSNSLLFVAALSPDQLSVFDSGINYYDVCGGSSSDTSSSSGGTANGTPTGGEAFDLSTGGQTTIDTDGSDPKYAGTQNQQTTTNLNVSQPQPTALNTEQINWYVLQTGWAAAHGNIQLGDIAALTYQNKTVYAVFGDNNGSGSSEHSEISVRATTALQGKNDNIPGNLHYTIYPGSHKLLHIPDNNGTGANFSGTMDQLQAQIDQIGPQLSGAGSASGSSDSGNSSSSSGCCDSNSTANDASASTLELSYTNSNRGNIKVPVTVYLPSDNQPHPLLVFAPGQNQSSDTIGRYAAYLKAVAADGFVVAGLDFTDNHSEGAIPGDAQDMSFVIDQLQTESKLQGKIATNDGVGIFGHSDGGTAVMDVGYGSAKNSKVKAVLAGSGGNNGVSGGPPLLVMDGGSTDFAGAQAESAYSSARLSYKSQATFKGASHTAYMMDTSRYNQPADDLTGAFFHRFLEGKADSSTDLQTVARKYSSLVSFTQQGNANPQGSSPSSSPAVTSTSSAGGQCCPSSTTTGVSGSISPAVGKGMSPAVQQRFQQIMVAAGQKFGVNPNFVATFYYIEDGLAGGDSTNNADSASPPPRTGDGNWKEPPPPYGHGPPYPPPNSATATGPFQFINSTWASIGQDGNGDGKKDVNDLTDAAFAAAALLASDGAKNTTDDAKLRAAAEAYNHSSTYAQSALNTFHYLTGKGSTSVSGSSSGSCDGGAAAADGTLVFPLKISVAVPQSSWSQDQGVDISTNGGACGKNSPEYAMGNGVIVGRGISGFGPDAPVLHITDTTGPLAGRYLYYGHAGDSQNSNGAGRPPGTDIGGKVTAGQVITYTGCGDVGISTGPHIEIGIFPKGASSPTDFPSRNQTSAEMLQILVQAYNNTKANNSLQKPTP